MKKFVKKKNFRFASIFFSLLLMFYLYKNINFVEFRLLVDNSKVLVLLGSFLISIVLGIIAGWRYSFFSKFFNFEKFPSLKTSMKSYFISSSINLILPSKIGDLSKGYLCNFLDKYQYDFKIHLYTIYEKLSDLFGILFIGFIASFTITFDSKKIFYDFNLDHLFLDKTNLFWTYLLVMLILFFILLPLKNENKFFNFLNNFKSRIFLRIKKYLLKVNDLKSILKKSDFLFYQLISIAIWIVNIFQICLFADAIGINLWSDSGVIIIITTIIFGLFPISFAGIGTRDALLVYLLSPNYGDVKPLFLGLLMTSRYLIPAFMGVYFLKDVSFQFSKKN